MALVSSVPDPEGTPARCRPCCSTRAHLSVSCRYPKFFYTCFDPPQTDAGLFHGTNGPKEKSGE